MKLKYYFWLVLLTALIMKPALAQEAPALPQGLGEKKEEKKETPNLPAGLGAASKKEETEGKATVLPEGLGSEAEKGKLPFNFTGFWEIRTGYRVQDDNFQDDDILGETRFQFELDKLWKGINFELTADLYYDWVDHNHSVDLNRGEGFLDIREASAAFSPFDFMDVKIGRQILTWGTGDLIFINDLFPKDWVSFFIGRDVEYLKAPSDAVKASFYTDIANLDIVYTPQFDSDRFITGERLSYWNGRRIAGSDDIVRTDKPDDCFRDDELAMRLSKNISGYELAAYGYWGYWKSPAGVNPVSGRFTFPGLNVYGASIRGQVGDGIGNIELGYYDSEDDKSGDDPFIDNSQMRYLIGYEQDLPEIANDFTVATQYYVEQTLDYNEYRRNLPPGNKAVEEYRQVVTFRITKLYWNQNLTCSLFTFFSPTDKDVYMRPKVNYKVTDNLAVEAGANVFFGDYTHTFFNQFRDNTNIYTALRYSF